MSFCTCKDWLELKTNREIIKWSPEYGWLLNWIEITEEKGYTRLHRYGIPISFCPMCGKKLLIKK